MPTPPATGLTDEERALLQRLRDKERASSGGGGGGAAHEPLSSHPGPAGGLMARLRGGGWPWATLAVCAAWIALYFLLRAQGGGVVTAEVIERWGGLDNAAVRGGEFHRLVTAPFLHASFIELVFNVWFLFVAGRTLERLAGRSGFLLYFLLSAAGAGVVVVVRDGTTSLLSEGATFGSIGALMGLYFRHRRRLPAGAGAMFFGFVPILVIYAVLAAAGYSAGMDPNELFGGVAVGMALPFVTPALGVFAVPGRRGAAARRAVPVVVAALLALGWGRVAAGAAGWIAPAAVTYTAPSAGWSLELPPGFVGEEAGARAVEFRHPQRERVFRARLDRDLVNASRDEIRRRLGAAYRRLSGGEATTDDFPLGGAPWVILRERDGAGRLSAAAASESSARGRGLVLDVAAPAEEAEAAWRELLHAAATWREAE